MIQVEMNKDVRKYKEKLLGPFSAREVVCLGLGAGLSYLVKALFFPDVSLASDVTGYIVVLCMIPFALLGWGRVYGMYMEKFMQSAFQTMISPKKRYYDNGLKREKKRIRTRKSKDKELQPFK